jgi:uncharacterized protein
VLGAADRAVRRFCFAALRLYRIALSPLLGPSCRFIPTCSHYTEEAIARWGTLRGIGLGVWRILRCHPFSRGGLDPVPERPADEDRSLSRSAPIIRQGHGGET